MPREFPPQTRYRIQAKASFEITTPQRMKSSLLWLKNIFRAPRQVGSIMPSSSRLAHRMARQAADFLPQGGEGRVIEIGAGTGAITTALTNLLPHARLTLVEADPACCRHLRDQFPRAEIIEGLIEDSLHQLLSPCQRLVLVSSVPLFSLKSAQRDRVLGSFETLLEGSAAARVMQYTYVPWLPGPRARWLCGQAVQSVWQNIPPAWVWSSTHYASERYGSISEQIETAIRPCPSRVWDARG